MHVTPTSFANGSSYYTIPPVHSSPIRMVERLYFSSFSGDWIFDSERNTDWLSIGLPFPNYTDRDRDILQEESLLNSMKGPPTVSQNNSTMNSHGKPKSLAEMFKNFFGVHRKEEEFIQHQKLNSSISQNLSSNILPDNSPLTRTFSKRYDRQYINAEGLATVRVGGQGFIWLPSASGKVSDISKSNEEKQERARKVLTSLEHAVVSIVDCYEILLVDILEKCFSVLDCIELIDSIIESSIEVNAETENSKKVSSGGRSNSNFPSENIEAQKI
jgi:hypothetical protein